MEQDQRLTVLFTPRGAAVAAGAAIAAALVIGVPTAVLPNPYFARMTPTRPQDYAFLALTALLVGLIAATYAAPHGVAGAAREGGERRLTSGGLLAFLAVGCPICNKLVVLALGAGGALRWFAPVQPLLGVASLALLGTVAWARLRAVRAGCPACVATQAPRHSREGA